MGNIDWIDPCKAIGKLPNIKSKYIDKIRLKNKKYICMKHGCEVTVMRPNYQTIATIRLIIEIKD